MTREPGPATRAVLPPAGVLAPLVSHVTSTMLGLPFGLVEGHERIELRRWRSAVLPIGGGGELEVALASDEHGCALLGSRMFQVALAEVDARMIDDTLCELVNMAAGMIKRALGPEMLLGLPRVVPAAGLAAPPAGGSRLLLRTADGAVELVLLVFQPVVGDGSKGEGLP